MLNRIGIYTGDWWGILREKDPLGRFRRR